mmetsp:Transcript_21710/g.25064  ORF Transcript_21710/g.25064 Transcript_21710/m.25064 type:complete len:334 (+) Transcript_21710:448-1449(+)
MTQQQQHHDLKKHKKKDKQQQKIQKVEIIKVTKPFDYGFNGQVEHLSKPLLSYSYSPAFSFSKCHLETNVPHDNFMTQFYDTETFTRYVRMFTRGYDVYTPTRNIVYHDYTEVDTNLFYRNATTATDYKAWRHDDYERKEAISRVHSLLEVKEEDSAARFESKNDLKRANLGIYGIGKVRSLKQLQEFVGIDLKKGEGHLIGGNPFPNGQSSRIRERGHYIQKLDKPPPCANLNWVPYVEDASNSLISPIDNLYVEANDLDPQPEFPRRDVSRISLSMYYDEAMDSREITPSSPVYHFLFLVCLFSTTLAFIYLFLKQHKLLLEKYLKRGKQH